MVMRDCRKLNLVCDYDYEQGTVYVRKKGAGSMYNKIRSHFMEGTNRFYKIDSDKMPLRTARTYCSMLRREGFLGLKVIPAGKEAYIWYENPTTREFLMCEFKDKLYNLKQYFNEDDIIEAKRYFDSIFFPQPEQEIETENTVAEDNEVFVEPVLYVKPEIVFDNSEPEDDDF